MPLNEYLERQRLLQATLPMAATSNSAIAQAPQRVDQNISNEFLTPAVVKKKRRSHEPNEEFTRITRARSLRSTTKPNFLNTTPLVNNQQMIDTSITQPRSSRTQIIRKKN